MTLWELGKAKTAAVDHIDSSLNQQIVARLCEMGIASGRLVQCVRRGPLGGPMVIQLGGSVFAVEQDLATCIKISPTD